MSAVAVLIASGELLPVLQSRLAADFELLAFADVDALRALETITTRKPDTVLLEKRFAATPRGSALINRVKADPSLAPIRLRLIASDATSAEAAEELPQPAAPEPPTPLVVPAPLDHRGTRRAPRFRTAAGPEILVDGKPGAVVDISTLGVQLLTPAVLKPTQRVRVVIPEEQGAIRCAAVVMWAAFEIPKGAAPRYRAGLEFLDADAAAVDAFARRHGVPD